MAWATGTSLTRNPRFVRELEAKLGKDEVVLLLCRSGKRSALAAEAARQGRASATCSTCWKASKASSTRASSVAPWAAGACTACPGCRTERAADLNEGSGDERARGRNRGPLPGIPAARPGRRRRRTARGARPMAQRAAARPRARRARVPVARGLARIVDDLAGALFPMRLGPEPTCARRARTSTSATRSTSRCTPCSRRCGSSCATMRARGTDGHGEHDAEASTRWPPIGARLRRRAAGASARCSTATCWPPTTATRRRAASTRCCCAIRASWR